MIKISFEHRRIHSKLWRKVYYIYTSDMFRPLMWPSSGWWWQRM